METEYISVEYRILKEHCECCGQKTEEPRESQPYHFNFSKKQIKEQSAYWNQVSKHDEDFDEALEEYAYSTIGFYGGHSSYETILIDIGEVEKIRNFIVNEVINS